MWRPAVLEGKEEKRACTTVCLSLPLWMSCWPSRWVSGLSYGLEGLKGLKEQPSSPLSTWRSFSSLATVNFSSCVSHPVCNLFIKKRRNGRETLDYRLSFSNHQLKLSPGIPMRMESALLAHPLCKSRGHSTVTDGDASGHCHTVKKKKKISLLWPIENLREDSNLIILESVR